MYLVTGATGFIGKKIAISLSDLGFKVRVSVREITSNVLTSNSGIELHVINNINGRTDWLSCLANIDTIIHCAAHVQPRTEHRSDYFNNCLEVNLVGTMNLVRQAAAAGVHRFVFISSIKVCGEFTLLGQSFSDDCSFSPKDVYSYTKSEAERSLLTFAQQTGIELVIIRPPLVYGPGVKGNFSDIVCAVQRGWLLPFGAVNNQRSLVALDNLVSFVLLCADRSRSPKAVNQIFVVADGEDVSTSTLLRKLARAAGRPSRLLPVPASWLRAGASLLGKRAMADRLLSNLQVDATKARTLLGWRPVVTMDEQLASMFTTPASHSRPMLRVLDVTLSAAGLLLLWPVLLLVCVVVWFYTRSPLFTQERVGRHQRPFVLVKFRTMRPGTAHMASHLVSSASITRLGSLLRRTKLDELPQLWNVLLGHMSLVGPRPGLHNQHELTQARAALGVYAARPGITGLAQVNGIDMSTPELLAQTDARMLRELCVLSYFKFIFLTVLGKGAGDRVKK